MLTEGLSKADVKAALAALIRVIDATGASMRPLLGIYQRADAQLFGKTGTASNLVVENSRVFQSCLSTGWEDLSGRVSSDTAAALVLIIAAELGSELMIPHDFLIRGGADSR